MTRATPKRQRQTKPDAPESTKAAGTGKPTSGTAKAPRPLAQALDEADQAIKEDWEKLTAELTADQLEDLRRGERQANKDYLARAGWHDATPDQLAEQSRGVRPASVTKTPKTQRDAKRPHAGKASAAVGGRVPPSPALSDSSRVEGVDGAAVAAKEPSAKGRGRPRTDRNPSRENPAFRRVRAAEQIQAELYSAACSVCDGRPLDEVTCSLRQNLAMQAPLARDLKPDEATAFAVNLPAVSAPTATTIDRAGGPEKWAEFATGPLLGHGRHWYRDAVGRSPWTPGKRRRYSPAPAMKREMKRHPSRFDRFTAEERCFPPLPAKARTAIETVVSDAWKAELLEWAAALDSGQGWRKRRDFPIVDYFARGPKERRLLGVPPSLKYIVWNAIGRLDKRLRDAVRARCRRPLTKRRLGARSLTGMAIEVDKAARRTGKIVRDCDSPDDCTTVGGRRHRNYVDVTPLPVLGQPSD